MQKRTRPGRLPAIVLLLVACLSGCDQTVDKGDDKLTEGRQSVEVEYKDSVQVVLFDDLETRYPIDDESPMVRVDDVVIGSGMVTEAALQKVFLNFVGKDGFTPVGVCPPDQAPTPGEYADNGYIERGTTRMVWDASLNFEKCMTVKDVIAVEVADSADELPLSEHEDQADGGAGSQITPSQEGVPFKEVQIHMGDQVETVQVEGLPTSTLLGETVVLVETLIESSGFGVDLSTITIDFEGSDGYRPTQKGMCTDYLPTAGTNAGECGINLETSELLWDESLDVEKCAAVKLVAHIYLEPAE
jgi:hypothetical protein